jgi:hypothetical protein
MDFTNKTLSVLLVAAIVISLGGTLIGLNKLRQGATGFATTAQVNLTISTDATCNVDWGVNFGASAPAATTQIISSDKNYAAPLTFNNCTDGEAVNNCKGLQINNTGNVNLSVNITSTVTAATFLINQTPLAATDFIYYMRNGTYLNNTQGCLFFGNQSGIVNLTSMNICQKFMPSVTNNVMTVEYNVTMQPDLSPGLKTGTMTISCLQTA